MNQGKISKVDDLTLIKFLGKGSYGEVYLTKKDGKSELFATKKMDRKIMDQPQISKYFKNEIAILRELKYHRNIVKLEDVKMTKKHYYLVMEYCNGGSLSDCLKKYQNKTGQPFSQEIVQFLMKQIINVMKYIHSLGIIHRDLKLDNILVNFDTDFDKNNVNMMKATVKIIDFGFAMHMGTSNLCYSTVGSPINMDPNILIKMNNNKMGINTGETLGYDQKADIWSLGTLCYEMLIGKSAFNSQSMQELVDKVENGTYSIPTHLSKEVVSFLNAMLQFNSQKRLSCDELSRHAFLTKNVNDFEPIDLRKVSNKVQRNNLNINIKRNNTIWSIFNEEDENKLINIPGNYLMPVIKEEDEFNYSINNYPYDTDSNHQSNINNINNNNTQQYQGYGVGYDGINAYQNTNNNKSNNNQGYGFSNYPQQQYQIPQMQQNNQNNYQNIDFNIPLIGKVDDDSNNNENNFVPKGPKILPIAEIPSFGVPSPGENPNERGYEYSSGIFRTPTPAIKEEGYSSVYQGYGVSGAY
jgi:serine/threonine protein kinase